MTDQNTVSETHTTPPRQYLGCGYVIDHLPEPRCPECGREFDLNCPETFYLRSPSVRRKVIRRSACAAVAFLAGAVGFAWLYMLLPARSFSLPLFALYMAAFDSLGVGFVFSSRVAAAMSKGLPPWSVGGLSQKIRLLVLETLELTLLMAAIFCFGWPLVAFTRAVNC